MRNYVQHKTIKNNEQEGSKIMSKNMLNYEEELGNIINANVENEKNERSNTINKNVINFMSGAIISPLFDKMCDITTVSKVYIIQKNV